MNRFFPVLLFLLTSGLYAQSPIITVEAGNTIPINIQASGELKTILQNDFKLTGVTNVVESGAEDYVLTATVAGSTVSGTLKTSSGQNRFTKNFSGEIRNAAHQLADAVILNLTGKPGFASSQVTFVSKQSGHKEIYVMDIDGARVRQITRDQSISLGPKFSHDSKRIAFTSYKSGYPDVWVIDLNKSSKRSIAHFPGVNSGASFSPNGNQLALTLSKDGNTDLYTMPSTGGTPTRLVRTRGTEASPSWSPNGSQIIFVSDVRGTPQLYMVSSKGGQMSKLKSYATYTTEPSWSPDGHFIAYSIMTAGQSQIAITDLRTKKQTILTSGGNNESPSWARDSRHVIFSKSGSLYLCDSVSRKTTRLNNNISSCTEPNISR